MPEAIENKKADTAATTKTENPSAVQVVQSKDMAAKQTQAEKVYDSPPSEPDDDLWLAHGSKMLEDSVPSLRNAASELIKALGMLQTAYLAILGFAKFVPENLDVWKKAFFIIPMIPWVAATYYCLRVMKTEIISINLRSPSDIREKASQLLEAKQKNLDLAFALLAAGITFAFLMVIFRLRL